MKMSGTLGVATDISQYFPKGVGNRGEDFIFAHVTLYFAKPELYEVQPCRVLRSRIGPYLRAEAEATSEGVGFLVQVMVNDMYLRRPTLLLHERCEKVREPNTRVLLGGLAPDERTV